jgi:hypothetical protein
MSVQLHNYTEKEGFMPIFSQSGDCRSGYSPFRRVALTVGVALVVAATANAAGFIIEGSVITPGGGRSFSAGGCLAVDASIGQNTVGVSTGGSFSLRAGYWPAVTKRPDRMFNNGFQECL